MLQLQRKTVSIFLFFSFLHELLTTTTNGQATYKGRITATERRPPPLPTQVL